MKSKKIKLTDIKKLYNQNNNTDNIDIKTKTCDLLIEKPNNQTSNISLEINKNNEMDKTEINLKIVRCLSEAILAKTK